MEEVSQTKIALWRKCRYAYYLRYDKRLQARVKARPLRFGSLIHKAIEADANGDDPFKLLMADIKAETKKVFASERPAILETGRDADIIMRDYFKFWKDEPLRFIRREKRNSEHEFHVPLTKEITLTGKLDAIALAKDRRWLVENKTFTRMPNEDHRWRNLQSSLYSRVIEILKVRVDGMCWNYVRSRPPAVPQVLKNGKLSLRRLDTLPTALREWLSDNKRSSKEVGSLIKNAEANRKNYFIRVFSRFNSKTVDQVWNEAIETAEEIAEYAGVKRAKTIDRHCDWCEFEPICRAELTDSDTQFVIRREFVTREKREAVEIKAE